MPLILPGNVATATAVTTYSVDNSCMFNVGDVPTMIKTLGTPTDLNKWTISVWVKLGALDIGTNRVVFQLFDDGTNYTSAIFFNSSDNLEFGNRVSSHVGRLITNREFRDPSAWYHIVCVWDSDNGTAGDRMKMYVNGVEETSFSTDTNPSSGEASSGESGHTANISAHGTVDYNWGGYMAEIFFCDGQAYAASDFGEFDSDSPTIWKPKDVSGSLTFGTNGFYLDFKDSANLGNDANGGTDLTESNVAAEDQMTDTPTNNFATLNGLDFWKGGDVAATASTATTLTEGNNTFTCASGNVGFARATMAVTAGKWYWEAKANSVSKGFYGCCNGDIMIPGNVPQIASINYYEAVPDFRSGTQTITTGVTSISDDSILGFALDMDNYAFYISNDGTYMNSGDPTSGASRTGAISELFTTGRAILSDFGEIFPLVLNTSDSGTINTSVNFGSPSYANSSDAADENGYGAFEFAPPSGYLALCTKNLGSDGG